MSQILLIRHGQTDWNRVERFRGRADLDLNQTGLRQAQAIAERAAPLNIAFLYSSPLRRAWRTAEIISKRLGLTPQPSESLLDIDYGEWEGLSPTEAEIKYPELYALWRESPHQVKFPGGESLAEVERRAAAFLKSLREQHPEQTIGLVSHKIVCQVLICHILGLELSHLWQIEQEVATINFFIKQGSFLIATHLNETCHLREEARV